MESNLFSEEVYVDILKGISNKKDKVSFIMEHFEDARNSDNFLCLMYWKLVDRVKHMDDIARATGPEAIRRARQRVNEKGLFLPTDPKVRIQRGLSQQ